MKLSLNNLFASVITATEAERMWLHELLKYDVPHAEHADSFIAGKWDGMARLYNHVLHRFPAGLVGLVQSQAGAKKFRVEVDDTRTRIDPVPFNASWLDPQRSQPQALEACLRRGRGVVWMPTGSGKTEVIVALASSIPGSWLLLTHKSQLLGQMAQRFALRTGEEVGICGDSHWDPKRITVATFQTLHKKRKLEKVRRLVYAAQGLVIDECHILAASTFSAVVGWCPHAYWRFGFSATPFGRSDGRDMLLAAATGPVIHRARAEVLVEQGVLSRPRIVFVLHSGEPDRVVWTDTYQRNVVYSEGRNALVMEIVKAARKPSLVFVSEIDHGDILKSKVEGAGMNVAFLHGAHDTRARDSAIQLLQRGDLDVLISSEIMSEGVDIPEIESVVNAAGGKSSIKAIQRLGRGMRLSGGKTSTQMFDIDDVGSNVLLKHSAKRREIYSDEGFEVVQVDKLEQA